MEVVPNCPVKGVGALPRQHIEDAARVATVLSCVVVQQDADLLERLVRRIRDSGVVEEVVPHQAVEEHQVLRVARPGHGIGGPAALVGLGRRGIYAGHARQQGRQSNHVLAVDGQLFHQLVVDHRAERG